MEVYEAVNAAGVTNIAEGIIAEETKILKNNEKKKLLLTAKPNQVISNSIVERITNGGENSHSDILAGTAIISQTGHIFLRATGQEFVDIFFDLKNRFELLDSKGKLVFYAGETLEDCGEGTNECLGARSSVIFDVSILGRNGGGIINIRANKAGVVTISDFHNILGAILDVDICIRYVAHKKFSVRDANNNEMFKIRAKKNRLSKDIEYEIYDKEMRAIGYFSQNWSSATIETINVICKDGCIAPTQQEHAQNIQDVLFGVCVPRNMHPTEKILLIGGLFTIYFQHLHEGHPSNKHTFFGLLVLIIVGTIIIALVVGILLYVFL